MTEAALLKMGAEAIYGYRVTDVQAVLDTAGRQKSKMILEIVMSEIRDRPVE